MQAKPIIQFHFALYSIALPPMEIVVQHTVDSLLRPILVLDREIQGLQELIYQLDELTDFLEGIDDLQRLVGRVRATQRILRGVLGQLQLQKMVEMTRLQRALHIYFRQWHQPPPLQWEDRR